MSEAKRVSCGTHAPREPKGWEELPSPKDMSQRELRGVVSHRRGADKVNPFIRWATAVTRELRRESRLSHLRGRRWGKKVVWAREVRTLLGVHDVLPFLDTVGGPHHELFQVMERFLRAFKQCRGDVPATLRALGVRAGHRRGEPYFVKLPADQRA